MPKKGSLAPSTDAASTKNPHQKLAEQSSPQQKRHRGSTRGGAKHIPHYLDQHEDYMSVSRARLREIATFGWLQEGVGGIGMFLFGGAFWEAVRELAQQPKFEITPWLGMFAVSMIFGAVLMGISYKHFDLKRQYIKDLFREAEDGVSE